MVPATYMSRTATGHAPATGDAPAGFVRRQPLSIAINILLPAAAFLLSWRVLRVPQANLTLSDILLIGAAMALLFGGRLATKPFERLSGLWAAGLILLLGGLLISSLAHADAVRWVIVAGQYIFALLVIPMTLASLSEALLRRCVIAFIYGAALSQAISLILSAFFANPELAPILGHGFLTGNARLGAMTGEPNPNGAITAFALVMLLHATLSGWLRWFTALPLAAALGWGLLASASFTGFTAASLGCFLFLAISHPANIARIGIPLALAITIYTSLGGPVPEIFEERVGTALATGNPDKAGTFTGRSALIEEAWEMADDNLMLGMGTDRYRVHSIYGAPVHHIHLLVLNEGGLVALIGLWTLFGAMIICACAVLNRSRHDGAACLGVLSVFFVYTMSMPHMYTRIWAGPVLLYLAWALARLAIVRASVPVTYAQVRAWTQARRQS